jgi:hypothetical protein
MILVSLELFPTAGGTRWRLSGRYDGMTAIRERRITVWERRGTVPHAESSSPASVLRACLEDVLARVPAEEPR